MNSKKPIDINDPEFRRILLELERRKKYRIMDFFVPFPKQAEFFKLGASYTERMFFAGNQLGKSEAGAFESACHLTGHYPEWWEGRRWNRPVKAWACGITSLNVRDVSQRKLCGEPGVEAALGTGFIPKEFFVEKPSLARGITDSFDTAQVRHKSGGISILKFKSYEQGWTKFQGDEIDFGWLDEEPPDEKIYTECVTRLTATNGMLFTTFTPLAGKTPLVCRFMDQRSPERVMLTMTIDDVPDPPMTPEKKAALLERYPQHMRKAKLYGVPMFGEGLVFDVDEDLIKEKAFAVPAHWSKLWSIDFGIGHPFAAVLNAWDKDADVIHVVDAFRMKDARPVDHARKMKPYGDIWVAWPRDGTNREAGSGKPLKHYYQDEGLKMLHEHAAWEDGGISTEAGVEEMLGRMKTGRYKVAEHLTEWWEEFRTYHRKDGQIQKVRDDLMSASRVGVMAKRFARPAEGGSPKSVNTVRKFNPFHRGEPQKRTQMFGRGR